MLRILLIILVALAVIIGLMRLTGAKPGDAAPASAVVEEPGAEAVDPAAEGVIEEPTVDMLDAPAASEDGTTPEITSPAVDGAAGEGAETVEDVPAETAPPAPDVSAPAVAEPAPAVDEPQPAAVPDAPGL